MTVVGDALESAFGPWPQHQSRFSAGRSWRDFALRVEAGRRADEAAGRTPGPPAHPDAHPTEQTWRRWHQPPDRRRFEYDDPRGTITSVTVGSTWWIWEPAVGGVTNRGRTNHVFRVGPGEGLLDHPRDLLVDLAIEGGDETVAAGRPAFELVASHVSGRSRRNGADSARVIVDRDLPLLLLVEWRIDDRPFEVHEVTELALDRPVSPETFEPATPDGSPFVDLEDAGPS